MFWFKRLIAVMLVFWIPLCSARAETLDPVPPGVTLWHLAQDVQHHKMKALSVAQVAVALWYSNTHGFFCNNPHGLRARAVLQLPSIAFIQHISPDWARKQLKFQATLWQSQRQHLYLCWHEPLPLYPTSDPIRTIEPWFIHWQQRLQRMQEEQRLLMHRIQALDVALQMHGDRGFRPMNQQPSMSRFELLVDAGVGLLVVIMLVGMIRWIVSTRRPKPSLDPLNPPVIADDQQEYDFLNTEEGLDAKLNLAQAYQEMGDIKGARRILNSVLQQGNEAQKKIAQTMLAALNDCE